jgi:nucleotide-binding universal stress UspA family protein
MKVLVPLDDAQLLEQVVEFIIAQNLPAETHFRLLHVIEFQPDEVALSCSSEVHVFLQQQTEAAEDLLTSAEKLIVKHYPRASCTLSVVQGLPVESILEAATEWQPDLLVIGSHNRKGLAHFFLGSVAEAVSKSCNCSVALIRRKESRLATPSTAVELDTRPIAL